jgi:hypothetical protein
VYIGRMTYPECDATLRTDLSFRLQYNSEHHNGVSPFCSLPIDMIQFFPIDYMHQVCLGVMKRMLVCWTSGPKKVRLSCAQKIEISSRLLDFRSVITKEFSRKPRSLKELLHWKATEFRTFMLYSGFFAMRKILTDNVFPHFMCFSVALNVLLSETLSRDCRFRQFAHELLLHFVSSSAELYGDEFLVYNVHSLTHLAAETEHFGKLDSSSAFIFENYMQKIKRMARSARNPVVQVAHRLKEHDLCQNVTAVVGTSTCSIDKFCFKTPDNYCVLENNTCCQVLNVGKEQTTCMVFSHADPFLKFHVIHETWDFLR